MRRKEDLPIKKVTLNLFEDDWEKLQLWHQNLGASKVVREIIHAYVKANEEKFNQKVETVQLPINIEELPIP
jgi:hypothetical protein